jgi:excisionase family DNA binding protein
MSRDVQTTDKLFDVQQAAELLGVNPGTIRRWAQSGTLKGLKVGVRGDWRFTHEELLKLVRSHMAEPEAAAGSQVKNLKYDQAYRQNSELVPAEKSDLTDNTAAYLRSIVALQQKAQALQNEISAREILVKKLETETHKLKSEQHRLERINRAKDEFISIASHQLRTPATGVKQYIGMLLEGYFGEIGDDQSRCLQKAYDSNERQIKVVNDLLLIAKVDAGNIHLTSEDTDLVGLIADVVEEQRTEIAQHVQSIALLVPDALMAHIDPQYMRMVVENLLSNASKYSPSDTAIEVTARRTRDSVLISVRDHGIGISAEDQAKLYKKFSRIYNDQSVAEGNGLGLYWSKKIVELHHGQLLLDSEPGHGSVFTIQLPVTR